jgi:hypothetical protein
MHIHKLLLNAVATRIEALVTLGNKFMYSLVREICHLELSHVLTPFVNSTLLLKHSDLNQFFRKLNRWQ